MALFRMVVELSDPQIETLSRPEPAPTHTLFILIHLACQPTLRRTSALVTEWSQNWGHLDGLSY